tara:strand:+ start:485 stop:736 length:252 start_codon:yes stop_codon:yes gene_type:complete
MDPVYKKVQNLLLNKKSKKPFINIWTRSSLILKDYVGLNFCVYQGKRFIKLSINDEMVGHRFGEFSPTRVKHVYKKKKIKGKK